MVEEWDDEGVFEDVANLPIDAADLTERDPFDLLVPSKGRHWSTSTLKCSVWFFARNSNHLATSQKQLKN